MIFVRLCLKDDMIIKMESKGHAAVSQGVSIPCAGVSLVLRTAGRLLSALPAVNLDIRAEKEGDFFLELLSVGDIPVEWYYGVSSYILQALVDLQNDFPEHINLSVEEL